MNRPSIAALCAAIAFAVAPQLAPAQTATDAAAAAPVDHAAAVAALNGDAEKGARVFNKCKACHVADADTNRVGPFLHGVFGRHAGTVEGYNYSDAMKNSGKVWTVEELSAYLADPKVAIPGNKMTFPGLKKPEDIANLLTYLHGVAGDAPAQ